TRSPAEGIETPTPSAITGNIPMGENSVTPIPKAPTASASSGQLNFCVVMAVSLCSPVRGKTFGADQTAIGTGKTANRLYFVIAEGKVEDVEILGHPGRFGGFRQNDDPLLDLPAQADLCSGFAMFRTDLRDQLITRNRAVGHAEITRQGGTGLSGKAQHSRLIEIWVNLN